MFRQLSAIQKAGIFYVTALGLITVLTLIPGSNTAMMMYTPLAATLVMLFLVTRDGYRLDSWRRLGLTRLGFSAWAPALLLPLIAIVPGYILGIASGLLTFTMPESLATSERPILQIFIRIPLFILIATVTNSLGEEIGWRGYLLEKLNHLDTTRRWLLVGLLHGIWHLPVILFTDLYHAAGSALLVVPLFLTTVTLAGVLFGYVRSRSGSVWPASLAHSAHNVYWFVGEQVTTSSDAAVTGYIVGEAGLAALIGYGVLAFLLLRKELGQARRAVSPVVQQECVYTP